MAKQKILADSPKRLIKRYYQKLLRTGIPVEQMILFGSQAKGTARQWSDVDVCVVSPSFGKEPFRELVRLKQLTSDIDSLIEPVPYHPDDLADKYDPLAKEIRTHGIRIL